MGIAKFFSRGAVLSSTAAPSDLDLSLAFLGAIVESSDDAVVSKTLDGTIQSWNAGAQRIFGYAPHEVVGKNVKIIIPPELHDEERTILERIRAGQRVEHFDTIRVAKDGSRVPISLTISPIRDAQGTIVGASKIARDISERQRAHQDLQDSRYALATEAEALGRLSEASGRLWRCHDFSTGLDEILRTVIELSGADRGNVQLIDLSTRTLSIVASVGFDSDFLATFKEVPAEDAHAACARALSIRQPVVIEDVETDAAYAPLRAVAREAGYRAVVSVPLFAADDFPLGAISVHFAARHRPSESEMRRLLVYCRQASDFIQRVRLEHALRQREEALQEADRRKNEFIALLAHELRNPLAPIRFALATSQRADATGPQQSRAQDVIGRQVAIMTRLLDDLLDISRITRGTLELKKAPTQLLPIMETAIESAQPFITSRKHELSVSLTPHDIWLEADAVRLAQVFSNLLLNAAKYSDPGGRIRVSVANGDERIVVKVGDDGVGIDAEMMPRLFTLFAQSPASLHRSEQGLGVGLAMVKGLVELHGGSVEARSAGNGQGSEFTVHLPVGQVHSQRVSSLPAFEAGEPQQGLRVLVVDDNRDAADSCSTLLELSGHLVRAVYEGSHALELGEKFLPDVILLDIGLPDISGYEVAKRIRASKWGARVPLVAVTGWGQVEDRRRAFDVGFNHHLTKPVAPAEIERIISSIALAANSKAS